MSERGARGERFGRSTRPLGAFQDDALEHTTTIHLATCPAGLDGSGKPLRGLCQCLGRGRVLGERSVVQVLEEGPGAILVTFDHTRPFWIEAGALEVDRRPFGWGTGLAHNLSEEEGRERRRQEARRTPEDWRALEAWLEGHEVFPVPSKTRRRQVTTGEIVAKWPDQGKEIVSVKLQPWRVFGRATTELGWSLLLVDASLRPDQVLHLGWAQIDVLGLDGPDGRKRVESLVFPLFPLPDGTSTPGWTR